LSKNEKIRGDPHRYGLVSPTANGDKLANGLSSMSAWLGKSYFHLANAK
jgi:hypothetical protein